MNKSDWTKRRGAEETLVSFLSFLELKEIPEDYLESLHFSYEKGGECWLDILPKVEFEESQVEEVISYFSYINPKHFPPKEQIESIAFSELRGGKSRKCTKGIRCGNSCVSKKKECQDLLDQDRVERMRQGRISRSPEYQNVNDSRIKRVKIKAKTGQNYDLSTDRVHLAQRFYDGDFFLPSDTKGTVVNVRKRRGSTQITLQDISYVDRFGRLVKEDHVNLFIRGDAPVPFQVGRKYQVDGLEVEQYRNDPDRFGVRGESLKVEEVLDYAGI